MVRSMHIILHTILCLLNFLTAPKITYQNYIKVISSAAEDPIKIQFFPHGGFQSTFLSLESLVTPWSFIQTHEIPYFLPSGNLT